MDTELIKLQNIMSLSEQKLVSCVIQITKLCDWNKTKQKNKMLKQKVFFKTNKPKLIGSGCQSSDLKVRGVNVVFLLR